VRSIEAAPLKRLTKLEQDILWLRGQGSSIAEIAKSLQKDVRRVDEAWRRALMKCPSPLVEMVRTEDAIILNGLLERTLDRLNNCNSDEAFSQLVASAVRLIERRDRLFGADAPERHSIEVVDNTSAMEVARFLMEEIDRTRTTRISRPAVVHALEADSVT